MESTWSAVELVGAPKAVVPMGAEFLAPAAASAHSFVEILAPTASDGLPDVDALLAVCAENVVFPPAAAEASEGVALDTPRPSRVALETTAEELDNAAKWNRWRALLARIMEEIGLQLGRC